MKKQKITFEQFKISVLEDYRIVSESREASLLGRKEVLTGKAKFGIFGDGKEVAQVAMARAFQKGDFRSGYYRDQTFMFAIGELTLEAFFAQLYSNTDVNHEPASAGRQMNNHFATRSLDIDGNWKKIIEQFKCNQGIFCSIFYSFINGNIIKCNFIFTATNYIFILYAAIIKMIIC